MRTPSILACVFLIVTVSTGADELRHLTFHEAGGACVMPDGMGAPCNAVNAMTPEEYERLTRSTRRPEPQITWLGWAVAGEPLGPNEGTILKGPPAALRVNNRYELGLRDDGVVVWRKARKE